MDRKSAQATPKTSISDHELMSKRYHALMDHLTEGIAIIDLTGNISYANRSFISLTGYTAAELIGKDNSFLFDEKNLAIRADRVATRMQQDLDPYYITITRKDKTKRKLYVKSRNIFDDEEQLKESMIMVEDLTKKEELEHQLNISRHLREAYLESCPLTFFIKSESGEYLSVNEVPSKTTGTDRNTNRGRNTHEVWPKELASRLSIEDELVISQQKRIEIEDHFDGKDYIIHKFPILIDQKTTYVGGYFIEVTRQKATEKELRQAHEIALRNEEKYRILAEQAKDYIIHLSIEGNVLYMNPFAAEVTGMTPEQIEGIHISKLVDPEDLTRMMKNIRIVAEKGVGIKSTVKNVIFGRDIYFETHLEPVFDKSGKVVSVHTLSRDISDRIKVQDALAKSEEKYRFLTENARENIFKLDPEGTIIFMNEYGANLFHKTADELIGKKLASVINPDNIDTRMAMIDKVCELKEAVISTNPLYLSDRVAWFETNLVPVLNENKEVKSILGVSRDVTEREMAVKARQDSENRLNFALESSNTVAWTLKYPDYEIAFSDNVCGIIGIGSEDKKIVDTNYWTNLIFPEDREATAKAFTDLSKLKTDHVAHEYRIKNLHGHTLWMLTRGKITQYADDGSPLLISGTISDITHLKKTEHELDQINRNLERRIRLEIKKYQKQNELLVQKSKLESLGEMAAGIAHEINQPLGIILLSVENLNDAFNFGKADRPFIENKLSTISKSIDKIRSITDHMRVFSRDQKLEFNESFCINEVVRDIMSMIDTQYKNQQINLIVELEENLPIVTGKKIHMEQVLQNLVSNARYAVNKKAEQSTKPDYRKTIRITTKTDGKMVCILVRDNGTGISAKNLNQIFDPFFTTKHQDLGTGLGLSICYGLMQEMKGDIKFESKYGEFTLAIACLPIAAGKPKSNVLL